MRYYSFNKYLKEKYNTRVHRLSLNAGFTCPTKDGLIDDKGCIYCNEESYTVFTDLSFAVEEQIKKSIEYCKNRYKANKFIAYFQAGSNTYAPLEKLKEAYDVIKKFPDIVSLIISTRPDCVSDASLDLIASYKDKYEVWVEYGMQTVHEKTLEFINRKHTFTDTLRAIDMTRERGLKIGAHVILGLPGETKDDMLETASVISDLGIDGVKFHALHVLENTILASMYKENKIKLLDMEEYVDIICVFLGMLRESCVIFRLVSEAKDALLIGPKWINEKHNVMRLIEKTLEEKDIFQGKFCKVRV